MKKKNKQNKAKTSTTISAEPEYRLESLLENITPENQHAPIETGKAVGKELWA